jgi:hypothetical protein
MYAATKKDESNAADGYFSAGCKGGSNGRERKIEHRVG